MLLCGRLLQRSLIGFHSQRHVSSDEEAAISDASALSDPAAAVDSPDDGGVP